MPGSSLDSMGKPNQPPPPAKDDQIPMPDFNDVISGVLFSTDHPAICNGAHRISCKSHEFIKMISTLTL